MDKFAGGIEDRVGEVLIDPASSIAAVQPVQLASPYMDSVLSEVCGNRRGGGVYGSAFGQRREWEGQDLEIQNFAAAFGVITAAKAVEQVGAKLSCGTYRGRDGTHRVLGTHDLPRFDKIDGQLMFCEVLNEKDPATVRYVCTAFVSRAEIASRIQVRAPTQAKAEEVTKDMIARSARSLATTW